MEVHMHEHGPLYTRVPCVMFDDGGWVGWVVVLWCGGGWCCCCILLSFLWTHTHIPTVVVSLTTHDNMYGYMHVNVHVHVYVHGYLDFLVF